MNAFQKATADCDRPDCKLVDRGGVSTLMAWTPTYDKNGNRTDRGDPNIRHSTIQCLTCNREWDAKTQYGETTVTVRSQ